MPNDDTPGPGLLPNSGLLDAALTVPQVAQRLCKRDMREQDGCEWYHRAWPYLRLAGVCSNPGWHEKFYRDTLSDAYAHSRERIMICGAADFSMLALVTDTFQDSRPCHVSVLDACRTPLWACVQYASQIKIRIGVIHSDIRTAQLRAGQVSVIVTDSFLTQFDANTVDQVVRKWHEVLAPKGSVITTVRLVRSERPVELPKAESIVEILKEKVGSLELNLGLDSRQMSDLLRQYNKRKRRNFQGSIGDLERSFTAAGFEICSTEVAMVDLSGARATYARIYARKA